MAWPSLPHRQRHPRPAEVVTRSGRVFFEPAPQVGVLFGGRLPVGVTLYAVESQRALDLRSLELVHRIRGPHFMPVGARRWKRLQVRHSWGCPYSPCRIAGQGSSTLRVATSRPALGPARNRGDLGVDAAIDPVHGHAEIGHHGHDKQATNPPRSVYSMRSCPPSSWRSVRRVLTTSVVR